MITKVELKGSFVEPELSEVLTNKILRLFVKNGVSISQALEVCNNILIQMSRMALK